MEERSEWKGLIGLALRVLVYAVLLGIVCVLMMQGFRWPYEFSFYGESGLIEWSQILLLIGAALLFWRAGGVDKPQQPLMTILILLLACAIVRELDSFWDEQLGRHWWKGIVLTLVLLAGGVAFRHRETLGLSVMKLTCRPSFGILLTGALTILVFSRLFGYGDFWRELLNERAAASLVKEIAEECTELIGYLFILIGAFEHLHETKSERTSTEESSRQIRAYE
jgi:hypothetical protein